MKNKMLTALLVAAMLLVPVRLQADDPPPDKDLLLPACVVLGLGIVVTIGLWYACKNIPPPPGTCPCGCNSRTCGCPASERNQLVLTQPAPPSGTIVTNPPGSSALQTPRLNYSNAYVPFGAGSFTDDQGNAWKYDGAFSFSLQSSVDLTNWDYAVTVCGWLVGSSALFSVRSNDVTLANGYFTQANNPTNALPLDLPGGSKRFYRISCQ